MSSFDVNKMIIMGNVGMAPEKRDFSNGGSVVKFTVATNDSWKDKKTQEYVTDTEWHTVVCFNEFLGKLIMNNVTVGAKVYVEGESKTRFYMKDDVKHYVHECVIPKFSGDMKLVQRSENTPVDEGNAASSDQDFKDDIPF